MFFSHLLVAHLSRQDFQKNFVVISRSSSPISTSSDLSKKFLEIPRDQKKCPRDIFLPPGQKSGPTPSGLQFSRFFENFRKIWKNRPPPMPKSRSQNPKNRPRFPDFWVPKIGKFSEIFRKIGKSVQSSDRTAQSICTGAIWARFRQFYRFLGPNFCPIFVIGTRPTDLP